MRKHLSTVSAVILILIMWEMVVHAFVIPKYILPAPTQVVRALFADYALLFGHSIQTGIEAITGFLLAVLAGLALAVIMGLVPFVKRTFYPLLVISQTVPIMAVAPILIIWFGYGTMPKVIVVALVCFFPITVSLVEGLASVDQDMVKLLLAMGAKPWQIFKIVQFPGALPAFFAGLKISVTYSVMGAVIGEWLGASMGLGVYLTRSMHSFLIEKVFAAIVVIVVLSLLLFRLVSLCGRIMMPWYFLKSPWQR